MNFPLPNSNRDKVLHVFARHGQLNCDSASRLLIKLQRKQVTTAIYKLAEEGLLVRKGYSYELSEAAAEHFDSIETPTEYVGQIVPPRTSTEFKPLSAKHMLPRVSPRDDSPLREVSFKTGSIGFSVGYRA